MTTARLLLAAALLVAGVSGRCMTVCTKDGANKINKIGKTVITDKYVVDDTSADVSDESTYIAEKYVPGKYIESSEEYISKKYAPEKYIVEKPHKKHGKVIIDDEDMSEEKYIVEKPYKKHGKVIVDEVDESDEKYVVEKPYKKHGKVVVEEEDVSDEKYVVEKPYKKHGKIIVDEVDESDEKYIVEKPHKQGKVIIEEEEEEFVVPHEKEVEEKVFVEESVHTPEVIETGVEVVSGESSEEVVVVPAPHHVNEMTFNLNGAHLTWPCQSTRNIYQQSGRYISRNVIATRVQVWENRAFIAMPRYKSGVPITLGVIDLHSKNCHASVTPFPCWSMQEEGNCESLQSVVDLYVDANGILWVLDVGVVNTLEQPVRRCPPKVVGIELATGKVIKVIDLSGLITNSSRLQYLVVDYDKSGNAYVYVSDAATRAILVFDIYNNKGYRVVLPKAVTNGCTRKDVLYITLVRQSSGNALYFTYLSSPRLFYMKTSHLRQGHCNGAIVDVGPKPQGKRIVLLGTNDGNQLFWRYKGESDVYMFDTEKCFKLENSELVQKGGECRLATQVMSGYKNLMWVIESNFHDYIANNVGCVGASVQLHPLVMSCED